MHRARLADGTAVAVKVQRPNIRSVIERAKADGQLREDFQLGDMAVVNFMVGAAIDFTAPVDDGIWERYLCLVLAGLRPGSDTPLPRAALDEARGGEGDPTSRLLGARAEAVLVARGPGVVAGLPAVAGTRISLV